MKISKAIACDIREKLEILADEPDLLEDYGVTAGQVEDLIGSVPVRGGWWDVPAWATPVIRGELSDMAQIWRSEARNEADSDAAARGRREARGIDAVIRAL